MALSRRSFDRAYDLVVKSPQNHRAGTLVIMVAIALAACASPDQTASTTTPHTSSHPTTTTTGLPATSNTSTTPHSTTSFPSGDLNILFVGNSHTSTHDIPGTVEMLLESTTGTPIGIGHLSAGFLRVAIEDDSITGTIISGGWDVVVLQGHEISQSHSITYSTAETIALARLAIDSGARALFFSEWSRRSIDETEYIESIYTGIAAEASAEVIPVGRSWDLFLLDHPEYPLWGIDGNHSSAEGAFLAAATIAYFIAGPDATLNAGAEFETFLEVARITVEEYLIE